MEPHPIERRMEMLLRLIASEIRPCKACGEVLAFVKHRNGKVAPYTMDGTNHFVNCPNADTFRKTGHG